MNRPKRVRRGVNLAVASCCTLLAFTWGAIAGAGPADLQQELTASPVQTVQTKVSDQAAPVPRTGEEEPALRPNHPPLEEIPPIPMAEPVPLQEPPVGDAGVEELQDTGEASPVMGLPEDGRLVALGEEYAAWARSLWEALEYGSDPSESERVQKECEGLKAEEQRAAMQLQLEIATENGDTARLAQLEQALETLDQPGSATIPVDEPVQLPPEPDSRPERVPSQSPDDQRTEEGYDAR